MVSLVVIVILSVYYIINRYYYNYRSRGPGWAKGGDGVAYVMPDQAGKMASLVVIVILSVYYIM